MDWEAAYTQWQIAADAEDRDEYTRLETEAAAYLSALDDAQLQWHLRILTDCPTGSERETWLPKTWFLSRVYKKAAQLPEALFAPLIRAAIDEPDPSFNRRFVDPCLRAFGPRRVNLALLRFAETGTDAEKSGASNAFYWSLRRFRPDDGIREEPMEDVFLRGRCWRLTEFVNNADVSLRQSLLPMLKFDPALYPEALQALLPEAIAIARTHPDAYIRHRIEIQLGSAGPLQALPHRSPKGG